MAIPEKVAIVNDLKEKIKSSKNIFLTDYSGLDVEQMTELRREFRKGNITYLIAKNTLIRLAANEEGLDELSSFLKGPTAVAFGVDDANVPAKILYDSFKKLERPVIKCFIADGKLYSDVEELKALALMPSREELLTQILMGVQSPLTGLVASIEAPARELVSVLEAVLEAKK